MGHFDGWEDKLQAMKAELERQPHVTLDHFHLAPGLSAAELDRIEAARGLGLSAAVREFYGRWGSLQVLWHFDRPFVAGDRPFDPQRRYCLHDGHGFDGSIHVLPLEVAALEDWRAEQHATPPHAIVFDYFSLFHMMACESDPAGDRCLRGEDHGAGFDSIDRGFAAYLHVVLGAYGYMNRFVHLERWTQSRSGSLLADTNWDAAEAGFLDLDFTNERGVQAFHDEMLARVTSLVAEGRYEEAKDLIVEHTLDVNDPRVNGPLLDAHAALGDEEAFFETLGYARADGFDLAAHAERTQHRRFVDTERFRASITS